MVGGTANHLLAISSGMDATDDRTRLLDVRGIDEPFSDIVTALEDLDADETLVLVNSFEPEPLYAVLDARGFAYETSREAPDEWHVEITREHVR